MLALLSGQDGCVEAAKIYLFYGDISEDEFDKIKSHIVNPLDARIASMDLPDTLKNRYLVPDKVEKVEGFLSMTKEQLEEYLTKNVLVMTLEDLLFVQAYFRDTEKEIRQYGNQVLDTYCRTIAVLQPSTPSSNPLLLTRSRFNDQRNRMKSI